MTYVDAPPSALAELLAEVGEVSRRPVARAADLPPVSGVRVCDEDADGSLALRVYRPVDADVRRATGLLFLHGGGFVSGSIDMFHDRLAEVARRSHAVVVTVAYRLAPEYPYPAALAVLPYRTAVASTLCWHTRRRR